MNQILTFTTEPFLCHGRGVYDYYCGHVKSICSKFLYLNIFVIFADFQNVELCT